MPDRTTPNYRHNLAFPIAVVIAISLLAIGCSKSSGSSERQKHAGTGVVISVSRDQSKVEINHQEIKDYMPAMQMEYPVADKAILSDIKPGDKIEFTVEERAGIELVSEIHKL